MFDRTASNDTFTRALSTTSRTNSLPQPRSTATISLELSNSSPAVSKASSSAPPGLNYEDAQKEVADHVYEKKKKFWWFAVVASTNHALSYVVVSFATSVLSPKLGGTILGLSWMLNAVSGLTVATPIVRGMGFKYSMILSLVGYAIQIASMYWAIIAHNVYTSWTVAIVGNVISGFTSAVWWTSQGVYFEFVCQEIDRIQMAALPMNHSMIDEIRADISAHWTIIYQLADIVVFLSLSIFPFALGCSVHPIICGLTFVGALTTLLGFTFESIEKSSQAITFDEVYEAAVAVPKQVAHDARVSLLSPFVFGFGITTAMFAYYVNSDVVSGSSGLGEVSLGFLEAWSYFIAVISAFPYAYISSKYPRGQDWVIQFGSLSFALSGFFVLVLTDGQLGTWGVILVVKGLYGLGRGVFEGSCRAVYASMFVGDELATAFSAQTLSAGLSGGICFFLFGVMSRQVIGGVTVANGIIALAAYFLLMFVVDRNKRLPWRELIFGEQSKTPTGQDEKTRRNFVVVERPAEMAQSHNLQRRLLEEGHLANP